MTDLSLLSYSDVAIQLIFSYLYISKKTKISQQPRLINAFNSGIFISSSSFSDLSLEKNDIEIIASNLTLRSTIFSNITNPFNIYFISVTFQSTLNAKNVDFIDSQSSLFYVESSQVELLDTLKFQNVTNAQSMIEVFDGEGFNATNILLNQSSVLEQVFLFYETRGISLSSIEVSSYTKPLIKSYRSNFTLIENIKIKQSTKSIVLQD